jgi:hypothetical protein
MKFLEDVSLSAYVTFLFDANHPDENPPHQLAHSLPRPALKARTSSRPSDFIFHLFSRGSKDYTDDSQRTPRHSHVSKHRLNAFLSAVNVGDYVVHGQLEAYSCAYPRRPKPAPVGRLETGHLVPRRIC